jgi:predicted metal-dependent phosphoesterase TrpH
MNKYAWNDAMILDKIQEVLDIENIDDMDITPENLEKIKDLLSENISTEDINNSASILAESIDELKTTSKQDIKDYISRLINYLNKNNLKSIIGEYEGIEFEVFKNSTVEEVFKNYYNKYDETYGISNMLSDLGLK